MRYGICHHTPYVVPTCPPVSGRGSITSSLGNPIACVPHARDTLHCVKAGRDGASHAQTEACPGGRLPSPFHHLVPSKKSGVVGVSLRELGLRNGSPSDRGYPFNLAADLASRKRRDGRRRTPPCLGRPPWLELGSRSAGAASPAGCRRFSTYGRNVIHQAKPKATPTAAVSASCSVSTIMA